MIREMIVGGIVLLLFDVIFYFLTRLFYIHLGRLGRDPITGWPFFSFGYLISAAANGFFAKEIIQDILGEFHPWLWVLAIILCIVCLLFTFMSLGIAITKGEISAENNGK